MPVSPRETNAAALRSQRVLAYARLGVAQIDGQARLTQLYQDGAAKIRMPHPETRSLEAVLINTAGGMTGGDRVSWEIVVGAGASAVVTTQACEKIYRTSHGHAEVAARLVLGAGAHLSWLPQETIVYDGSAFRRRLDLDLGEGATALVAEATLFGRTAMGERVREASFHDRWRISAGGRFVHAEDFRIDGPIAARLLRKAVANGATAVATVLLVGAEDDGGILDQVRSIIGNEGGASAWTVGGCGKLLARLYAEDGYQLRRRLVPLLGLLNGGAGLPKTWSL